MLNKMKLAMKIGGGFGVVILLLVIISAVSWKSLSSIAGDFVTYRGLARHTNLSGRLQANMLMVRMNVKDFNATGSAKDIQQFDEYVKKMDVFIEEAHKEINNPARAEKIDFVTDKMHEYEKAFERVKAIRVERDTIVNETLNIHGPSMEKSLTEIMKTAKEDGDADAAYEAGIILRHMLLGRLYAQKYLGTNAPADFDRVNAEYSSVFKGVNRLDEMLQNPARRALNDKVKEEATIYVAAFTELDTIIQERNGIIANTLDKIGPQVAAAVEEVKLSVKEEQDVLGPIVQAKSENAVRLIMISAVIAIIIAVAAAFFITKTITAPVQRVVDFVEKLANGDFTMQLDIKQEDEIGNMSRSLGHTVIELGKMIKEIITGVNTLSSSSTELSAISTQLAGNAAEGSLKANGVASAAEELTTNMNSVSAAMEQSSSNVGMVATAAEEMSATVSEIAQNAARAKGISEEAVIQSKNTSTKINELGQAANKIGKVTEAITEISEQTNLLALNATIEAARAGEAGKGFAVVANEIKDLAKQTAEATVDIKDQIGEMQTTTDGTITDIEKIGQVIDEINEVITTIASAVEEQSSATIEISSNVSQAAAGIGEVNENVAQGSVAISDVTRDISEISSTSDEINSASDNVKDSATELSKLAEQLDNLVKRFKIA